MKRQLTEEQKAKREERVKRFRALWKQIADMPDLEWVQLSNKLGVVTVEGRQLSLNNQCLLALQNPTVSVVGGFRQWLKEGRAVQKGQHGLMIWVPSVKRDSNGEEVPTGEAEDTRFFIGTVFDIQQFGEFCDQREPARGGTKHPYSVEVEADGFLSPAGTFFTNGRGKGGVLYVLDGVELTGAVTVTVSDGTSTPPYLAALVL